MNTLEGLPELSLAQHLVIIMNGVLLSFLATFFAIKACFYRPLVTRDPIQAPSLKEFVFVFFIYFSINILVLPLAAQSWMYYQTEYGALTKSLFSVEAHVLIQGIAIWLTAFVMWLVCYRFKPEILRGLFSVDSAKNVKGILYQIGFGVMTWLICVPIVFTLNQVLVLLVDFIFHPDFSEQVAVKLLKMSYKNWIPFSMYFIGVITVVPLLEEFLFRGILQRWLSVKVGPWKGIILASIVFTGMHYASEQKYFNLVLLPCLFLLSCFLGYLYERQRSLWASIGLHGTFNMISALILLIRSSD